ncbi:DUF6160 family protein, partial [Pseudomonas aeruginosa]|uniref:DUF6160 family protein n=1 Tax=Pseudomonas aeruginosa TaxID=287 RepID=UPI0035B64A1D
MLPTRSLLPFFLAPALLASAASQAAMEALDNDSLSQVTGQAGISPVSYTHLRAHETL